MNRQANDKQQTIRTLCAGAAVFMTVAIVGSIDLLSRHYGAQAEFAAAKSIVVASDKR